MANQKLQINKQIKITFKSFTEKVRENTTQFFTLLPQNRIHLYFKPTFQTIQFQFF